MRITFLLERGSPPRLNPVLAEVVVQLEKRGASVSLRYPEEERLRLDRLRVTADLYVLKSDTELALSLATALEGMGARVLNRASASGLAKDKVTAAAILHAAGIPTPRSLIAARPAQFAGEIIRRPLMFKPPRGYHGVGLALAAAPEALPPPEAYPGFVFAQEYRSRARTDLKVFAIGDAVFGVRKAFSPDSFLQAGEPARLPRGVEEMSRRCGRAFGLELFGLDVAEDETGPQVVDVNYFPGYRGAPDAPRRLAAYIAQAAGGGG